MKIVRFTALAVVVCAAVANTAWAQAPGQWSRVSFLAAAPGEDEDEASPSDIVLPKPPVKENNEENEDQTTEQSVVGAPVAPIGEIPMVVPGGVAPPPCGGCASSVAPSCASGVGCASSAGCASRSYAAGCRHQCRCCASNCELGEPWKLCDDNCRGWFFGGWLNAGAYFNNHGNGRNGGNGPIPFVFNGNRGMLNQAWVNLGKRMVFEDRDWDWGWNADYVYGTDGPATQAFGDQGWDFGWNTSSTYGQAIPQLYVEGGTETLSTKFGRFYTIIGYEVVQAPSNFFYSHAYTMNFGEPFTHTGFLTTWTPNDETTVWGGYTFGWDSGWENGLEAHTFLGGFSRQLNDCTTFTFALNAGQFGDGTVVGGAPGGNVGDIYMHSIVLDRQVNDRFNWVFQSDFGTNRNVPGGGGEWYGINNYFFYTLTDRLRSGVRVEWFADPNGLRVGNGNGEYVGITGGLNMALTPNFMLRPELRYDTFGQYTGNPTAGFNPNVNGVNQSGSQWSYGLDGIWTF